MPKPSSRRPAPRARPPAPYLGGKRNLAARIVERIEAIDHTTYAEPFVGMGGVFFRRQTIPRSEVINDYNRDVATLFRILQRHYVPFVEMLRFQLTTRVEFDRLVETPPETLTDLERAARFLYLQRAGFGGLVRGRSFGVAPSRRFGFDVTQIVPHLEELHTRLAGVVVECLPFGEFIKRYDRPKTLFYLDPPYWGCERDYGPGLFRREDYERLAELLAGLRGRFILSLNDVPEVRATFAAFRQEKVQTTYTASAGPARRAKELVITS